MRPRFYNLKHPVSQTSLSQPVSTEGASAQPDLFTFDTEIAPVMEQDQSLQPVESSTIQDEGRSDVLSAEMEGQVSLTSISW